MRRAMSQRAPEWTTEGPVGALVLGVPTAAFCGQCASGLVSAADAMSGDHRGPDGGRCRGRSAPGSGNRNGPAAVAASVRSINAELQTDSTSRAPGRNWGLDTVLHRDPLVPCGLAAVGPVGEPLLAAVSKRRENHLRGAK